MSKRKTAFEHVNIGTGEDISIRDLEVVGFEGSIATDSSKPDGTPRKLLDVSKLEAMGWKPRYYLRCGLADAYEWFKANEATARLTV